MAPQVDLEKFPKLVNMICDYILAATNQAGAGHNRSTYQAMPGEVIWKK
jgi:hypothetical protein